MCTVSYIPNNTGFVLTSNRDENPGRNTQSPKEITLDSGEILTAPIDEQNNGTWVAATNKNRVACLLNGAFIKHERSLPYRKSRGLIVLEAFNYSSFSAFIQEINLTKIEPFTLILAEKNMLQVMIWDGTQKHHQLLDNNRSYLWSSSTLYSRDVHDNKLQFFDTYIKEETIAPNTILEMHGLYSDNLFILNRPQVKTVSITQVIIDNNKNVTLNYNLKREPVSA